MYYDSMLSALRRSPGIDNEKNENKSDQVSTWFTYASRIFSELYCSTQNRRVARRAVFVTRYTLEVIIALHTWRH